MQTYEELKAAKVQDSELVFSKVLPALSAHDGKAIGPQLVSEVAAALKDGSRASYVEGNGRRMISILRPMSGFTQWVVLAERNGVLDFAATKAGVEVFLATGWYP